MEVSAVRRLAAESLTSVGNLNDAARALGLTYRKRDNAPANEPGLWVPPSEYPDELMIGARQA